MIEFSSTLSSAIYVGAYCVQLEGGEREKNKKFSNRVYSQQRRPCVCRYFLESPLMYPSL